MDVNRRRFLKGFGLAGSGTMGFLGLNMKPSQAHAETVDLHRGKLSTTTCNFCSCGCGMIARVEDGKLLSIEGDPDHVINRGALCPKGAAVVPTHDSPQRVRKPLYRAPGADKWVEISWEEALDRVAKKIKTVRDENWIETETDGDKEYRVNRTDALAIMGGALNNNEENYLFAKMGRLLGTAYVEHCARL
jgi:formate dehydrogenase major subunit